MTKPLFLRALARENVERPPVWVMRQAGRYLSEYRALKEKYTFLQMCQTPELSIEVTMQPMRIVKPDAAIIFADILLPLEGMGISIDFNPGPIVENKIKAPDDIKKLTYSDPAKVTGYVGEALRGVKRELGSLFADEESRALIGFAGTPWTLACYTIDQGPLKHFAGTQVFAATYKKAFHEYLQKLTDTISDYLLFQIESGADAVQLFDSWGGILGEEDYREYSLPYATQIIERVKKTGCPIILYTNGSSHLVDSMAEANPTGLGIDWRTNLFKTVERFSGRFAIQGNFDPTNLFLPIEELTKKTNAMLKSVAGSPGYIVNLGHGILQTTPREHAIHFVKTIQQRT